MSSGPAAPAAGEGTPTGKRLPRAVWLFGAVSFLNDFASEMIYPLLPAFVTRVLGAGARALGALDGAAEFAAAFVKLGAGRLADRPQRRGPLVILGYVVAVLVRPVIAFTGAAWQVIGLRVVDRVGKGLRTPPRDALVADVTPAPLIGRAFGLHRGLDHAGAVMGPLVAWYLLAYRAADIRHVIAASIVPGLVVLVLAVLAVRGGKGRQGVVEAKRPPDHPLPPSSASYRPLPPAVFAISFFSLVRMPETLVILRSQQLGISVATMTLVWATVHVVKSASSFAGGSWSDRIGPGRTMWFGWVVYAVLAAWMALARSAGEAWAIFLFMGLVAGLTESPERALVAQYAGDRRGSGFGVYHAVTGLAALAGGLALGSVFQAWGADRAFLASAGLAAVLALASAARYLRGPSGVPN